MPRQKTDHERVSRPPVVRRRPSGAAILRRVTLEGANQLRVAPAVHTHEWEGGNMIRRQESYFLDIVIDGLSLRSTLPGVGDLVTELNRAAPRGS